MKRIAACTLAALLITAPAFASDSLAPVGSGFMGFKDVFGKHEDAPTNNGAREIDAKREKRCKNILSKLDYYKGMPPTNETLMLMQLYTTGCDYEKMANMLDLNN